MATPVGPYSPFYPAYQTTSAGQQHQPIAPSTVYSSAHLQNRHPIPRPVNPYWTNPHGSSVNVLTSLLPRSFGGPIIYYYYVATNEGFSLVLYHSKLENSMMRSFLSGCDPIGMRIDPVIMDTRYENIPPQLFTFFMQRARCIEGLPPHIALQGSWLEPDNRYNRRPSGIEIARLLVGETTEEQFPLFNLKLVPNTWVPMERNPDLKGVSFAHAGKDELTVWLHEPNSQAFGCALKAAKTASRKLAPLIKKTEKATKDTEQFLAGKNNITEQKLIQLLFTSLPFCKELIRAYRDQKQRETLVQIVANAKEYLSSLEYEKKKVDRELSELTAYQDKLKEIEQAQGNPIEVKRLQDELRFMPCPASSSQSTAQIRKQKALTSQERRFYLRQNLVETLDLFKLHSRFFKELDPAKTKEWMESGKWLATQKDRVCYEDSYDINVHLGNLSSPTWEQVEWLLNRFAGHENKFQRARVAPFIQEDLIWYSEAVSILEDHLKQTGHLTYELETKGEHLASQRKLLTGPDPIYIVKRPSVGGHIQSVAVSRYGKDPLETLDNVHIPVGG